MQRQLVQRDTGNLDFLLCQMLERYPNIPEDLQQPLRAARTALPTIETHQLTTRGLLPESTE